MKWYCRLLGRFFDISFSDVPCYVVTDKGNGAPMPGHEGCGRPGKHEIPSQAPKPTPTSTIGKHEGIPKPPPRRYHNWEFCNNIHCESGHW